MKLRIQYQYRPKDSERPSDYGPPFKLMTSPVILPNIGDHVDMNKGDRSTGVVENRLFHYVRELGETVCCINIVLTDSNVSQRQLLKE